MGFCDREFSQTKSGDDSSRRRIVLVVDDEASVRLILKRILERWGFGVVIAQDGQSGLSEFHRASPHLILTDVRMDGGDGLELIKSVRASRWQGKIVAMSGSSSFQNWREQAIELGANAILEKPFTTEGLHALIEALLPSRESPPQDRTVPDHVRDIG